MPARLLFMDKLQLYHIIRQGFTSQGFKTELRTISNAESRMSFDELALTWDNDPGKAERAAVFAREINTIINPDGKLDAIEFGCGTGLLSFSLKDSFRTITLADSSKGMIDVLKAKITNSGITHFRPIQADLFDVQPDIVPADVIYTLLTLHHIHDVDGAFARFNALLKPHGTLCIADLVTEDGSFHGTDSGFDGHQGFSRDALNVVAVSKGFITLHYYECYTIEKKVGDQKKQFPLFLMVFRKPA